MTQLLLLHGAIGSKDQFDTLSRALQNDFEVHTINFSGHGGLQITEIFSIDLFARDVLRYLSDNKISKIDVFGYSMGGYVALYLARHHPEQINRIFTLATKFNWTPEIAMREAKMLDADKIAEKVPVFARQLELRHKPEDWKKVLSGTSAMMNQMGFDNPLKAEDFQAVAHRVLVGVGDKDAMVTIDETLEIYRRLPLANIIVIPQMQHSLEKADVNRLTSEIKNFFV